MQYRITFHTRASGWEMPPFFDRGHPVFPLPTAALPTTTGALKGSAEEAVKVCTLDMPEPCEFPSLQWPERIPVEPPRSWSCSAPSWLGSEWVPNSSAGENNLQYMCCIQRQHVLISFHPFVPVKLGFSSGLTSPCSLDKLSTLREMKTRMVRACHATWQPLQNHPSGHLGGRAGNPVVGRGNAGWTSLPMPQLLTMASCRGCLADESSFMVPLPKTLPNWSSLTVA